MMQSVRMVKQVLMTVVAGALLAAVVSGSLFFSCGPQTEDGGKITLYNKKSTPVDAAGGKVGIDDGSTLAVPAGALAIGTNVTVQKVGQPSEFAALGVSAGSNPVEVSGVGPDGAALEQAAQPMTVSLAVLSGAGLADVNADNLCIVAKTKQKGLFVWRRAQVTLDDAAANAAVSTVYFGVFQVVYCGQDALPGFTDAALAGATGEARVKVEATLPAGFVADLPHEAACLGLLRAPAKDGKEAVLVGTSASVALQQGAGQLAVDAPESMFDAEHEPYVGLFLLPKDTACPLAVGADLMQAETLAAMQGFFAFRSTAAAVREGVTGTIGSVPFRLDYVVVGLGGPSDSAAFPASDESKVCFVAEPKDGESRLTALFAGGLINNAAQYKLPVPVGADGLVGTARVVARIGADCTANNQALRSDVKTGKPFEAVLEASTAAPSWLTPVTLQITATNPLLKGKTGCLEIYKSGSVAANTLNDPIGRMHLSLAGGSFKVYLPYTGASGAAAAATKYDMQVTVLDDGATCEDKKTSLPVVPLKDKTLSAVIEVKL